MIKIASLQVPIHPMQLYQVLRILQLQALIILTDQGPLRG